MSTELEASDVIVAHHANADVTAVELDHDEWERASPVRVARYWSGEEAPAGRQMEARVMWSDVALCVRFDCRQAEPLVISSAPQREEKTLGLWERDVCEIFIAPDEREPARYFEFEAAPTGEWLDLAIHQMASARETDWQYRSGMTVGARILEGRILIAMRVPWEAFPLRPHAGARWRANLFRCVGAGDGRGYLAWQPTRTGQPNFHVPHAFGKLELRG
ncbi:MAG: carbohydrate-binding family 9-like protein [Pyrinomonadaceae bacterium]